MHWMRNRPHNHKMVYFMITPVLRACLRYTFSAHLLFLILLMGACGEEAGPTSEALTTSPGKSDSISSATSDIPILLFDSEWNVRSSAPIVGGQKVAIDYDESRLPVCRTAQQGDPGWQITVYLMALPSQVIREAPLFAYQSTATAPNLQTWARQIPVFDVPLGSTEIKLWFKNSSGLNTSCTTWDSNFGKNYYFEVQTVTAGASLVFYRSGRIVQNGVLKPGENVTIIYDPARLEVASRSASGRLNYFAEKYHCYGYGCCEQHYKNSMYYRFKDSGDYQNSHLDGSPLEIPIPLETTRLELYFDTEVYTDVWYCGGAMGPKTQVGPDYFFDSNDNQNYIFSL